MMARGKRDKPEENGKPESDPSKLVKDLRKTFSKDDEDQISWDLSTEESPTSAKTFISTGSTLLDYVISNRRDGGVPTGKLTEIAGEEASGKSLIISHIIANAQKKGGIAVLMDTENAFNPAFGQQVGVDLKSLVYLQPNTIEKTFETVERIIVSARASNASCPIVIAWDGVAATPPQAEIEGGYDGNARIGLAGKALSLGMRKLTQTVGKEAITFVVTNQLKQKPGLVYGDPYYTPGGKAIPFHASVRIRLTSSTKLKDAEGNIYAVHTKANCKKTRLGPPFRKCEFDIHFDRGIDDVMSWFSFFHDRKMISKSAGYCTFEELLGGEKFREKQWYEMMRDEKTRNGVLDLLERNLTVVYKNLEDREAIEVKGEGDEIEGEE